VTSGALVWAALDAIGHVIWHSMLQVLLFGIRCSRFCQAKAGLKVAVGEALSVAMRLRRRREAVMGDGDSGVMVMSCRSRSMD
jgi:hypothetical protein